MGIKGRSWHRGRRPKAPGLRSHGSTGASAAHCKVQPAAKLQQTHLSCRREQPSMCFQLTAGYLLATHHCPNWNILPPPRVSINTRLRCQHSSLGLTAVLPSHTLKAALHNNLRNFTLRKKHTMWKRPAVSETDCGAPPYTLPYLRHGSHKTSHPSAPGQRAGEERLPQNTGHTSSSAGAWLWKHRAQTSEAPVPRQPPAQVWRSYQHTGQHLSTGHRATALSHQPGQSSHETAAHAT